MARAGAAASGCSDPLAEGVLGAVTGVASSLSSPFLSTSLEKTF